MNWQDRISQAAAALFIAWLAVTYFVQMGQTRREKIKSASMIELRRLHVIGEMVKAGVLTDPAEACAALRNPLETGRTGPPDGSPGGRHF